MARRRRSRQEARGARAGSARPSRPPPRLHPSPHRRAPPFRGRLARGSRHPVERARGDTAVSGAGTIAVAGAGRAGTALAVALARAGHAVRVWDRRPGAARRAARAAGAETARGLRGLLEGSRLLLAAVRDDALGAFAAAAAESWPERGGPRVALHLAGSRPAAALGALAARGAALGVFHPVVALHGARSADSLRGRFATVSGDRRALAEARRLARSLGMRALRVDDTARPLVHLAAVMAAGDVVALLDAAAALLGAAGVAPRRARDLLGALAESAVAGFRTSGLDALTGPIARGDAETLRRHAAGLAGAGLDAAPAARIHAGIASAAVERLRATGKLSGPAAAELARALDRLARGSGSRQDRRR
ncbi:MAG: DUF2520 domain-containing protein [Acidobacteria bacterium]|nr:MAG: DUF2520 domain-containing protein [Acidobacteriota bacterium]